MNRILFFLLLLFGAGSNLQAQTDFSISLEEITFADAPGLQSYAYGVWDGKWLLIGGKTNGLHDHRPPFSFLPQTRNTRLWVVDPVGQQVWSSPLSGLPTSLAEQLASTNMQFTQWEDQLVLTGGYGYHSGLDQWMTHPFLTLVDLPEVIEAIMEGNSVAPGFYQLEDDRLAVTGGALGYIDDTFYLIGGHWFDGRYNPMNGPSFVQEYTDAIRTFELAENGDEWEVENFSEILDPANLHRRDLNVLPQIFPNGSYGFTAFTGVFQYDLDVPWMNVVNIFADDYEVVGDFEQLFNQYHTAHLAVYDGANNSMHNFFFGGIGLYDVDAEGTVWVDSLVPFVSTISRVTRASDGTLAEFVLADKMPGYLGASAELILAEGVPLAGGGILDLDALSEEPTLVGYIFGGIESSQSNLFMQFSGSSEATNRMFAVYIQKGTNSTAAKVSMLSDQLLDSVYPNPVNRTLHIQGEAQSSGSLQLLLTDSYGRVHLVETIELTQPGPFAAVLTLDSIPAGKYYLEAQVGDERAVKRIVRE
jgi:hypothetical protein